MVEGLLAPCQAGKIPPRANLVLCPRDEMLYTSRGVGAFSPVDAGRRVEGGSMTDRRRLLWLVVGMLLGAAGVGLYFSQMPAARAANDRYEDYIMCTGPAASRPGAVTDGVWILDYRAGKLLGTLIDRTRGKILGWAEVDLVTEFGLPPRQNVHFLMTTGNISIGQAALYVAETTSGKIAVYTMGPRSDGKPGLMIRKHDQVLFRGQAKAG